MPSASAGAQSSSQVRREMRLEQEVSGLAFGQVRPKDWSSLNSGTKAAIMIDLQNQIDKLVKVS